MSHFRRWVRLLLHHYCPFLTWTAEKCLRSELLSLQPGHENNIPLCVRRCLLNPDGWRKLYKRKNQFRKTYSTSFLWDRLHSLWDTNGIQFWLFEARPGEPHLCVVSSIISAQRTSDSGDIGDSGWRCVWSRDARGFPFAWNSCRTDHRCRVFRQYECECDGPGSSCKRRTSHSSRNNTPDS